MKRAGLFVFILVAASVLAFSVSAQTSLSLWPPQPETDARTARELVFELKEPASEPLRLFVGNANVTAPHYDFEKELARLSKQPTNSAVTVLLANREYKPEPLPLTERVPWLIYLVLAASSIALGFVLFSLARTATRFKPQTD